MSISFDFKGDLKNIEKFLSRMSRGDIFKPLEKYGHGTGTGGYVQGRDYINPALRPVFDKIAEDV